VLPVRLINFKASLQTNTVQLTWATATEINSQDFVIQRSIDGIHFSNVGSVMASGNSMVEKSYNFNDDRYLDAASDILFYRLQMNDKDGKINYSQVQAVRLNTSSLIIKTYPNPVHNELTIIFGNLSSKASLLKITDVNGKQVYLQKIGNPNSPLQNIDVSDFA
jgi:hypothetical protein